MRVFLIVGLLPSPGGLSTATFRIARAMKASGDEVLIVTRDSQDRAPAGFGRLKTSLVDGLTVHYFPDLWFKAEAYGLCCLELRKLAEKFEPDVVHAYFAFPCAYLGAVVAKHLSVPLVVSCRGNDITQHILIRPSCVRLALKTADYVTAVSDSLLEWAKILAPYGASSPVYNSIEPVFAPMGLPSRAELRRSFGLSPAATVLGSNAVFVWKKGPEYLESLLRHLGTSDLPNLEFVLIGQYPDELRARLTRAFENPSSDGKSRRLIAVSRPARHDLPCLLASLDLFVLTSRREGMPNVLLEAMSVGTAVAATAVNGCVDLLTDPEAGLLLDPFEPDKGARQILQLLADPERLRRYADVGKKLMETKYSVEQELRNIKNIYKSVLEKMAR
jgi:glycosyltransferase involved in cell wall biosynthesis